MNCEAATSNPTTNTKPLPIRMTNMNNIKVKRMAVKLILNICFGKMPIKEEDQQVKNEDCQFNME